jgi:hypothetical protein
MTITNHAKQRSQQRSVPQSELNLIVEIGTPFNRPGHAIEYVVTDKDAQREIEHYKHMIQKMDKLKGKAVVTLGNSMLSTYHKRG